MIRTVLAFCAFVTLCMADAVRVEANDGFPAGASRFVFSGWNGVDLSVEVAAPKRIVSDTPIVFVMHGNSRNADTYRDNWLRLAREYGVLVIAPWFKRDQFRDNVQYNLGWTTTRSGTRRPRSQWTFSALEPLFDHVVSRVGSTETSYAIFGHSAGSQFVHRFLYHVPDARVSHAVLANAGWYTMPDYEQEWPYGLKGTPVREDDLRGVYAKSVTVLLGDQDIDTAGRSLRKTPEANLQGPHRFARGKNFFLVSRRKARALETPFNWSIGVVPGADHNNAKMAPPALEVILAARARADQDP